MHLHIKTVLLICSSRTSKFVHSLTNKRQLLGDFVPQAPYRGFAPGPHWGGPLGDFRPPDTLAPLSHILNTPLYLTPSTVHCWGVWQIRKFAESSKKNHQDGQRTWKYGVWTTGWGSLDCTHVNTEQRRLCGDLIEMLVYKTSTGKEGLDTSEFFQFATTVSPLKGHSLKLFMPQARLHLRRKHFFSHRVVSYWNRLPQHVVKALSLNYFKARLYRHWKDIDVFTP